MLRNSFKILLLLIVGLFIITGCGNKDNDNELFKKEFEALNGQTDDNGSVNRTVQIDKDNPFVYDTAEGIAKRIQNKESFIVFFGYASDPWSRCIIEALVSSSKEESLNTFYYVDIYDIRNEVSVNKNGEVVTTKEGTEGYNKILELLSDNLDDYVITNSSGEIITTVGKRINSPSIISIISGKFDSITDGISDDLYSPYDELTDDMINYSKSVFKPQIKKVVDAINSCNIDGC